MLLSFIVILLHVAARGVAASSADFALVGNKYWAMLYLAYARLSPAQNDELLEGRKINSNHADVRRA
jgi:hypothetical protein